MEGGKTRRDFGSFHASNVQELLCLPDEEYVPPSMPFELSSFKYIQEHGKFEFGEHCRQHHFLLEKNCTFLNHGAFGCVLKEALYDAQKWQLYAERQPLRFYDRELLPHLVYVTRRLAKFVGCDAKDLVLVTNATMGINCVLRSLKFSPGDIILSYDFTYGAVKKLLRQVCKDTGAELKEITTHFPISDPQELIEALKSDVGEAGVKLLVLDHIPSNTPFIVPVCNIVTLCHQHNVQVLVDGAHTLGALPLNLEELNADFYVSNAHKWLCAPKGAAFLHVKKEHKDLIHPLVISHGYGSGFNSEFIWTGLHDYSPFLALHTVLDFWHAVGPEVIRNYMYETAKHAAHVLSGAWKVELPIPLSMFRCMILVPLPSRFCSPNQRADYAAAEKIQNILYHKFNIEIPVKAVQGQLYLRLSAHIHTTDRDTDILAEAINSLSLEDISHF